MEDGTGKLEGKKMKTRISEEVLAAAEACGIAEDDMEVRVEAGVKKI